MNKVKKFFQSKQPVVPTSWEIIPFQKAVSIISDKGKRIKQKEYLEFGEFPVIDQGQEYIGGYTNDKNLVFDGNLPVIVFGDHTRTIKYINEPFSVGADGIKILKPENCYSFKFFYYLLTSLQIPNRGYSRHFQFLRNFYFPLPPLPEQHRIVAEIEKQFSRLDEAVAGLKRIQANLKRYRASVLKAAVEGKLTAEWRKQHPDTEPAEQLLQRILKERRSQWEQSELEKMQSAGKPPKDEQWKQKYKEPVKPDISGLPELPEGWVWSCVEQAFRSVTDGDNQPPPKSKSGIPLLVIGNVASGKLDFTNTRFVESSYYEALTDSRTVKEGDILYTVVGSFGIPVKVNTANKFCVQRHIAILKPDDHIVSDYLYQGLKSNLIYKQAADVSTGTAQKTVSLGGLRNIKLPLPPLTEQTLIVSEVERRLSIADEVEQQININLKRAERMRQAILKKAFSGKLVSQDPNDEPASVLLENIKQGQRA